MSEPIILYDIPSTVGAWSPNTWKTRYTLNFKGLPFKTEWVEYPDIEPLFKKLGVAPTEKKADGRDHYTLPVIYDPNTQRALSESFAIVRYLDATYPNTPTLVPAGTAALQMAFLHAYMSTALGSLFNIMLSPLLQKMNPPSEKYFRETREKKFGMPVEAFSPLGPVRDRHWAETKAGHSIVAGWIEADGVDQAYVGGDSPIFADIILVSFLQSMKVVFGEESEEWKAIEKWDNGRWGRLIEDFKKFE